MTATVTVFMIEPTRLSFVESLRLIRDEWLWLSVTSPGAIPKRLVDAREHQALHPSPTPSEAPARRSARQLTTNGPECRRAIRTPDARLHPMNARTRKVLEEALELPSEERGELARRLVESLQDTAPPEVEAAWADVIARRAREVLDGTAATRDLDEGLAEVEARARAVIR